MAIWQNPPPKPVMARPAVNCEAPPAVAVTMKPIQQHALPKSKNSRRPNRSEFAPAIKNPIAFAVVYAGTYQAEDKGAPNFAASFDCSAAVVGTGQKLRPKVDDRTNITNQVFQVVATLSPSAFCRTVGGGEGTTLICSTSCFSSEEAWAWL